MSKQNELPGRVGIVRCSACEDISIASGTCPSCGSNAPFSTQAEYVRSPSLPLKHDVLRQQALTAMSNYCALILESQRGGTIERSYDEWHYEQLLATKALIIAYERLTATPTALESLTTVPSPPEREIALAHAKKLNPESETVFTDNQGTWYGARLDNHPTTDCFEITEALSKS